ncbi:DUF416 family protein [Pedobacter heparinus]|uniref:DUF416 family protein n=1 Tax=Pedobacter heparinus TaxID=984 RepID=UPI0029308420|nr:DUF416 family protein [Pedobacter heparinus]
MKILNLIKNIINGKPKAGQFSYVFEFPKQKNGEYTLSRADRNTGIVLNEKFKYAGSDHERVYTEFGNIEEAINTAREIAKANATVEIYVYDHNEQLVCYIDIEKEKFHNPYLEFNFKLKQQIDISPEEMLLAFGLNICKRLLPEYIKFYDRHQWGDPGALTEVINYCESHKINEMQKTKLQDYHNRIDAVTPDTEDFGDSDGSYALNAGCSVITLLDFLITGDKASIFDISTYMTDTVDFKLREAHPDLTEKEIDEHADMINERKYQLELLRC